MHIISDLFVLAAEFRSELTADPHLLPLDCITSIEAFQQKSQFRLPVGFIFFQP